MTGELSITDTISISIPEGQSYIILDNEDLPNEPQESWYIEDGEIKIDQQKLIEFNRNQMPTLSKREFRGRLRDANLFDQVDAYVKASNDGYLQDAWEYADYFTRLDPFIIQVSLDIGLTPERVDQIWTVAA
ncbi:hypothetical protein [Acinetobacter johnsonii]|uniref:hypothetical protein n=1 Tax=Acinetobacter johnsonii TaxID=40214 RepID=UPI002936AB04|nr:hypothetical protein [Acinetobacter johnsonii]MDV2489340.1 hypothetical protein [Acinetobacter johnsonii]